MDNTLIFKLYFSVNLNKHAGCQLTYSFIIQNFEFLITKVFTNILRISWLNFVLEDLQILKLLVKIILKLWPSKHEISHCD